MSFSLLLYLQVGELLPYVPLPPIFLLFISIKYRHRWENYPTLKSCLPEVNCGKMTVITWCVHIQYIYLGTSCYVMGFVLSSHRAQFGYELYKLYLVIEKEEKNYEFKIFNWHFNKINKLIFIDKKYISILIFVQFGE